MHEKTLATYGFVQSSAGIGAEKENRQRKLLAAMLFGLVLFLTNVSFCRAQETGEGTVYTNPDTGYRVVVEDSADLLTEEERDSIAETMKEITAYGNVAFLTVNENYSSAESLARSYYMDQFGTDSGTLFLIDMDNRKIWIHSDGAVYRTVTTAYANTVTDNVYRYASREDYYQCSEEAFEQINALLKGQKIARPMKYISNVFLALILALLLNFALVSRLTKLRKPAKDSILSGAQKRFFFTQPGAEFLSETKIYSPIESGSDSGGSGSDSGGGGGSSSSGGGGGHSF